MRRLVVVLGLTQTVGYGVLYYAFAVVLTPMSTDLHASRAAVTAAFTVSVVVSALVAVPVGRWLDRRGGRALMSAGSALGVLAVLAWSTVHSLVALYLVFAIVGLASAMSLYDAAFPVLIAASPADRRTKALLGVTIAAGFASTIFYPLTAVLVHHYGWRHALVLLAAGLALCTIPAHLVVVPGRAEHHRRTATASGVAVAAALRDKGFWLLTVAFVVQAAAVAAVSVVLIGYLVRSGHPATTAATLAGLLGICSVTGRLVTTGLAARFGMAAVAASVFVLQAIGLAALPLMVGSVAGAAVCVIAFGMGFGVAAIARPAILAHRYGTTRYATIAAAMAFPMALARAIGPLAAASVAATVFVLGCALACLVGGILLWAAGRYEQPQPLASSPPVLVDSMAVELD